MSLASFNESISRAHYEKMQAISTLDFERAEMLNTEINQYSTDKAELLFQEIRKEIKNELFEINDAYEQKIKHIHDQYEVDQQRMKRDHDSLYTKLQSEQLSQLNNLEYKKQALIDSCKEDPVDRYEELVEKSQYRAELGDFNGAKEIRDAANEIWRQVIQQRMEEICNQIEDEREQMLVEHTEAADLLVRECDEKKQQLKAEVDRKKEDAELQFALSANLLKNKCQVRCQVIKTDKGSVRKHIEDLEEMISQFVITRKIDQDNAKREQARRTMLTTAATKTRKIMAETHEEYEMKPKNYTKRIATTRTGLRTPKSSRYLPKSFFTTQADQK